MFLQRFQQNHLILSEKSIIGQALPFQKCELQYQNAKTAYCNVGYQFSAQSQTYCIELLSNWADVWREQFPHENTWVRKMVDVPSLIIRIDCTIDSSGVGIYEVEERPAGIGSTCLINADFVNRLQSIRKTWPQFSVVHSPKRTWEDDSLWAEVVTPEHVFSSSELVLVRAEPDETDFHGLTKRSVSSLRTKGDKKYGVSLGLWRKIVQPEALPLNEAFVLKTLQGSKTRGVFMYSPKKLPGSETKTKISRVYEEHGEGMYLQKFMPPMESHLDCFGESQYPFMIYRTYFGYNRLTHSWECLGGLWNARRSVKIHGASDSMFGPLVPQN